MSISLTAQTSTSIIEVMKRFTLLLGLVFILNGLGVIPCAMAGASHCCCPKADGLEVTRSIPCCAQETRTAAPAALSKSTESETVAQPLALITQAFQRPNVFPFSNVRNVHWGGGPKTPTYLSNKALLL